MATALHSRPRAPSSLRDLTDLLGRLGWSGPVRAVDAAALALPEGPALGEAALLATEPLPWLLVSASDPAAAAPALARRRAAAGHLCGVAAIGPAPGRIALAVALQDTPVLLLPPGRPGPAERAALERLGPVPGAGALAEALRIAGILAIEPPGARFFRAFASTHARCAAALPAGPDAPARHALALLQLTRVLFLYFVQAKGWLDGRPAFLREEVDRCLAARGGIHRRLLVPLFFGSLNRPLAARRPSARRFGALPFLNGGLFEPHPLERRWPAAIPDEAWRAAFDDCFERFHFDAHESADGPRIAPEMLGRVFEGLMEPGERHRSGSYYTPAPLVRQVLDAALAARIAARLGIPFAEAAVRLAAREPAACAALRGVTLLDPACGSGAFLLGALERLAALTRDPGESAAAARRRVLRTSLFGVDRNPMAVRLAELRLWLAVIAVDERAAPELVEPLPNLDAVVRQGDALHDLPAAVARDAGVLARLAGARTALVTASGPAKRAAARTLRTAELAAALDAARNEVAAAEHAVRELLAAARAPTLFGDRAPVPSVLAQRLHLARRRLRAARAAERELRRDGMLGTFDFRTHFADVLGAGGFDVVVGNPPWVRGELLPRAERRRLAERFAWFRPAPGGGWRNAPDLAVVFLERSVALAREGGAVAMLVPAKLCTAGYAAPAREGLAARCALQVVAEPAMPPGARFDATTYPLALVATRGAPAPGHVAALSLGGAGGTVPQSALAGGAPWVHAGDPLRRLVARLRGEHGTLGARFPARLGVKTGADDLFLTREPDIEDALLRPALRGRDVAPFRAVPRLLLRWPCGAEGEPLARLPPRAAAWFTRYDARLRARADWRGGPPWSLFRTRWAAAGHRVAWADLARGLQAVALDDDPRGPVPLNTCYVVRVTSAAVAHRLALLLNATWLRALAALEAPPAQGGFRRFPARVVDALPLPAALLADVTLDPLHAEALRGTDIQLPLDERVADHLGLEAADRRALSAVVERRAGPAR